MRTIRGPLGVAALVLVLVAPGRQAARPLVLHGPERQARELVGLVWADDGARLSQLDEQTLQPLGPPSARLGFVGTWALERGGRPLAASDVNRFCGDTTQVVRFGIVRTRHLVRPAH